MAQKGSKKGSEVRVQTLLLKTMLTAFLWIKRLIAKFNALGSSFWEVGPGFFCTTMHRRILWSFSPSSWWKKGSPYYSTYHTR
jgi:hypothetical protein